MKKIQNSFHKPQSGYILTIGDIEKFSAIQGTKQ